MDWNHYNVHWLHNGIKRKTGFTALSKEDAKNIFDKYAQIKGNSYGIPVGTVATKVVGPLGMHKRTNKQIAAGNYRWILGNIATIESTLNSTPLYIADVKEMSRRNMCIVGLRSNIAKVKRDVRELFKMLGLNVK